MSAMGSTAVPGLLFRPLCRIQQLSILFPLWRRALRQVPNGSPANLQSATSTSRIPNPDPRSNKYSVSKSHVHPGAGFKICAATETNQDRVQNPICGRYQIGLGGPLPLPLPLPRSHPLWWACQACTSRRPTLSVGALQIQGRLRRWACTPPLCLSACPSHGFHLEFCKRAEAIHSSCDAFYTRHPSSCLCTLDILPKDKNIHRQVVGGGRPLQLPGTGLGDFSHASIFNQGHG